MEGTKLQKNVHLSVSLFLFCSELPQHSTEVRYTLGIKSKCFYDVPNQWHFFIINLQL